MSNKRFSVHGRSSGAQASGSLRLPEPVLVLARAVALVDGVSVEQLIADLVRQRGLALGLDALAQATSDSEART